MPYYIEPILVFRAYTGQATARQEVGKCDLLSTRFETNNSVVWRLIR